MEPLSHRGLPRLSWIDTLYSSTWPGLGARRGGRAVDPRYLLCNAALCWGGMLWRWSRGGRRFWAEPSPGRGQVVLAGGCAPLLEHPACPGDRSELASVGPASPRLQGAAAHSRGLHDG